MRPSSTPVGGNDFGDPGEPRTASGNGCRPRRRARLRGRRGADVSSEWRHRSAGVGGVVSFGVTLRVESTRHHGLRGAAVRRRQARAHRRTRCGAGILARRAPRAPGRTARLGAGTPPAIRGGNHLGVSSSGGGGRWKRRRISHSGTVRAGRTPWGSSSPTGSASFILRAFRRSCGGGGWRSIRRCAMGAGRRRITTDPSSDIWIPQGRGGEGASDRPLFLSGPPQGRARQAGCGSAAGREYETRSFHRGVASPSARMRARTYAHWASAAGPR